MVKAGSLRVELKQWRLLFACQIEFWHTVAYSGVARTQNLGAPRIISNYGKNLGARGPVALTSYIKEKRLDQKILRMRPPVLAPTPWKKRVM